MNDILLIMRVSKLDLEFIKKLRENPFSRAVNLCYQCGACTAGCPSSLYTALKTRGIVHRAALGNKDILDTPELWLCLMCYKCTSNCRVGLDVTNLIAVLRNIAARQKKAPAAFLRSAKLFHGTGFAFPVTKYTEKLRSELDLKPLKTDSGVVKEVQKLASIAKMKDIIEV